MVNIGKNIRALRIRKKMTQDELAEKLYVSHQTVSNYETGKTRPDIDTLIKIAEIMDVDVNVLIYGIPSQKDASDGRIQNLILLAATAGLGIMLDFISDYLRFQIQRTMQPAPYYLTLTLVFPGYYLLAGWITMHAASTFLYTRSFQGKFTSKIHLLLIVLACSWYVFLLPECTMLLADHLGLIHRTRFFEVVSAWDYIANRLFSLVLQQKTAFLFLPLGIGLRITNPRRTASQDWTSNIS